jgi:hypothetical protein
MKILICDVYVKSFRILINLNRNKGGRFIIPSQTNNKLSGGLNVGVGIKGTGLFSLLLFGIKGNATLFMIILRFKYHPLKLLSPTSQ